MERALPGFVIYGDVYSAPKIDEMARGLPTRPFPTSHLPELDLEIIKPHMTQNPMLRGEVDARALPI